MASRDKKATEAAERKAAEERVDLSKVEGSGADGKVTVADVETKAAEPERRFEVSISPRLGGNVDHVTIYGVDYYEGQPLAESEFERLKEVGRDTAGHQMILKGKEVK